MSNADKEAESVLASTLQDMSRLKWEGWKAPEHRGQGRVSRKLGHYRLEGSRPAGWNVLDATDKEKAVGLSLSEAKRTAEALEAERKAFHVSEGARLKAVADKARANPHGNVVRAPKVVIEGTSPIEAANAGKVTYTQAATPTKSADAEKPEPKKHGKHK